MTKEISNKSSGTEFENSLANYLSIKGFWVSHDVQDKDGQSADLIACKAGQVYLIDGKVCSNGFFDLNRIEDNQNLSMKKFAECGNGTGLFIIWINPRQIFVVDLDSLLELKKTRRILYSHDLDSIGTSLELWADEVRL